MDFWISFWTKFFIVSLILFALLAVVVTVGGFFNIRSLFKNLKGRCEQSEQGAVEENS
ncbi:MAG: hypothetical protein JW837_00425 [Sedimentisphaerales bacterium]|nr:hypothetical protein [Sedimentisphaerales bacterium]